MLSHATKHSYQIYGPQDEQSDKQHSHNIVWGPIKVVHDHLNFRTFADVV